MYIITIQMKSALTHLKYSNIKYSKDNSYFSSKYSKHSKEVQQVQDYSLKSN